jgi:hypothetical protein
VNLLRFIRPSPFVGPDSNSAWRKYSVAGQTDDRYREGEVKVAVARCDLEVMLRAADGAVQGVPVTEPECLTPMWRMRAAGSSI